MRKAYLIIYTLFISLFNALPTIAQTITADPLTGRAVASIPIWTVNSGDLASSISLSYSSNGIKVNDGENTAGIGWGINANGGVYRELRSLPDDFVGSTSGITNDTRNGWLHGSVARQSVFNGSTLASQLSPYNNTDSEPDIFSFIAPGLRGGFVFDQHKGIRTMPYQDVNIQFTRGADSLINQIVITNNLGIQYTFQAGDYGNASAVLGPGHSSVACFNHQYQLYSPGAIRYSTAWYLTKMTSPKGGSIIYSYINAPFYLWGSDDVKQIINTSNKVDTLYTVTKINNYTSQRLQSVTGSNEVATFTWNGNRLASVSISDLTYQTVIKKFRLQYHYVVGSKKVKKSDRAFLSSVNEEIGCNAFPGFQFNYYGVNFATDTTSLPFGSSIRQDLFGYYDSTATSGVPDIYQSNGDVSTNGERYRIASAPNYTLLAGGGGRSVNPTKVYFGSLKSVTLPMGSTTTFVYEAADYRDLTTSSNILGGGARVKSIKISSGNPAADITSTYKYRSSTTPSASSGQWVYRPMFIAFDNTGTAVKVPYNIAPNEEILYSRVEVSTMGQGRTVYEFQNSGMYQNLGANDFSATYSWQNPGTTVGVSKPGYYTYPYAPNTNYDFERGLPVRITGYARNGKIVSRTSYTYQRTTLTIPPIVGTQIDGPLFAQYNILSNVDKVTATISERVYDQAYTDSTTQFVETVSTNTYNANQMLSQRAVTNSDNSITYNTFKYAKDYGPGDVTQVIMLNNLVANNQHGTLVESVVSNGSTVTGASLTMFNNTFGGSRILPMQQLTLGDPTGFTPSTVTGGSFVYDQANYYPVAYFDAYDPLGNVTIQRDQSRTIKSIITGYNYSSAALEIGNARNDQVVFSDFEPKLNTPVTTTASTTTTDSYSGQYSLALTSSTSIQQSTVVRGAGKNYRFSCWAKAASSTTLSLSVNGAAATAIAYPKAGGVVGTWQYLEAIIPMSSVAAGANFTFALSASGNINVDNVVFYPESATVLAHSYDPLNGKTADVDSRGNAGFQEYDALGRLHYIRNLDKDVLQIKDYHYQTASSVLPESSFTGENYPAIGQSYTYTANPNPCSSNVTYAWQGTSANSPTFTILRIPNKYFTLKLVATSSTGTSTTEIIIQPINGVY